MALRLEDTDGANGCGIPNVDQRCRPYSEYLLGEDFETEMTTEEGNLVAPAESEAALDH